MRSKKPDIILPSQSDGTSTDDPNLTGEHDSLRSKLLRELGKYSLVCGMAVTGSMGLLGCDDDEWYKEIRLKDCNGDGRIDTKDRKCQDKLEDDDDDESSSGDDDWYNHSNSYTDYYDWLDLSTW